MIYEDKCVDQSGKKKKSAHGSEFFSEQQGLHGFTDFSCIILTEDIACYITYYHLMLNEFKPSSSPSERVTVSGIFSHLFITGK